MKIVFLSDTHGQHREVSVPPGDCLIHAGDLTREGSLRVLKDFRDWFEDLPHTHKIVIAGNHDFPLEEQPVRDKAERILSPFHYLRDSGVTIEGIEFWGSPWSPEFHNWAFNLPRGEPLRKKWNQIPESTDVLVTHSPPKGIGDRVKFQWKNVGSSELRRRVNEVNPDLHVFGHIHEGYGQYEENGVQFINASVNTFFNNTNNDPIVVDYERAS